MLCFLVIFLSFFILFLVLNILISTLKYIFFLINFNHILTHFTTERFGYLCLFLICISQTLSWQNGRRWERQENLHTTMCSVPHRWEGNTKELMNCVLILVVTSNHFFFHFIRSFFAWYATATSQKYIIIIYIMSISYLINYCYYSNSLLYLYSSGWTTQNWSKPEWPIWS